MKISGNINIRLGLFVFLSASFLIIGAVQARWIDRFVDEDLIEYWSADQLARRGENPYDGAAMSKEQLALHRTNIVPNMMWNPPLLLTVNRSFIGNSLGESGNRFLVFSAIVLILAGVCAPKGRGNVRADALVACAISFGIPTLTSMRAGQASFWLLLG